MPAERVTYSFGRFLLSSCEVDAQNRVLLSKKFKKTFDQLYERRSLIIKRLYALDGRSKLQFDH